MPIRVTIDVIQTTKAPGKSQPTVLLSSLFQLQFAEEAMQATTAKADHQMNHPIQREASAASSLLMTRTLRDGPSAKQAARDRAKDITSHRHDVRPTVPIDK